MTRILPPVSLEDQDDPSWERAQIRLAVAFETFVEANPIEHGIWIVVDEVPEAFANVISYLAYLGDETPAGVLAGAQYFDANAIFVKSWLGALAAIYPYFHGGEEMPK